MQHRARAPLNRDHVLDAAVAIADQQGVAGLSMRKLAKYLGYEVMSLYNHVNNKDDLLDGMIDRVAAEIDEPPADADWKTASRHIAMSAHDALVRHRWASGLWSSRWPGPARWRHMEILLRVLAEAGFPDDLADLGYHAITLHVQGFTQQQISYSMDDETTSEMFDRFTREVTVDEYPHVVEHVKYHQEVQAPQDEFGFVLDLILDGLDRARTAH